MDLRAPCNLYSSISLKPQLFRLFHSPPPTYQSSHKSFNSELRVTSELQSTAGVASRTSYDQTQAVPTHKVTVHDRFRGVTHEFLVPEDQYILHTAEDQDIALPFACRHGIEISKDGAFIGCCTSCAVRIKSGELRQPEALGISTELKEQGYALLCVGFPMTDLEVETQDEDEVYWLQFGRYFARGPIERDDYALELAMGDE